MITPDLHIDRALQYSEADNQDGSVSYRLDSLDVNCKLMDGLPWNSFMTFISSRGWTLMTLNTSWSFLPAMGGWHLRKISLDSVFVLIDKERWSVCEIVCVNAWTHRCKCICGCRYFNFINFNITKRQEKRLLWNLEQTLMVPRGGIVLTLMPWLYIWHHYQVFLSLSILFYESITAKLLIFPSASAVFRV